MRRIAILLLAATLAACGGGGDDGGGGSPPPTTDTTAPSIPQSVTAAAQSTSSILVSWQASTDVGGTVAGYRIYRDNGANPLTTVTGTSYTDTGLTPGQQYGYSVSAFDSATPANVSARSPTAFASTPTQVSGSGLDTRPDNSSCVAGDRPAQVVSLSHERAFANLPSFASPILMLQAPGNATRWYVVEQAGLVKVFDNQANVSTTRTFIDIRSRVVSGGEQGLLGMAFHPDFPADPRVYLSYTNGTSGLESRISVFRTTDGGLTLDSSAEEILLSTPQPAANHNGGHIAFGPDGMLYIGFGDGGSGGDPWGTIGNGQLLTTLLGKLLRIDIEGVSGSAPYRIPAGNPYAGNAPCARGSGGSSCPEIYAYGLRNPWRWSFDRGSGQLWLADVGQGALEEVNRITAGGNYGWRCFEGTNSYNSSCGPNSASSLPPVAQYARSAGVSVTGGFVYRGSAIPALSGRYVFGDFGSGRIWHIARDTAPTRTVTAPEAYASGLAIASFGEGIDGELYVVDYGGNLHRLRPGTGGGGGSIPAQLSATGCLSTSGLIPYAPVAGFWSDGATKERHLALPNGTSIALQADSDLDLPVGTVLVKHFSLASRRVETRLFMRHTDGDWAGYTYEWNAQGTDATRVVGGKTVPVSGQNWVFPSEAQCLVCHTAAAGRSLGLELAQLNAPFLYPQTGRTANQVQTFDAIRLFSAPLPAMSTWPSMPDPFGSGGTLTQRARAYLHTNCANCHRPGGGTPGDLDLRYTTPLASTNSCDRTPQAGDLGIANARIIAPGAASRSVLASRVQRRDAAAMPPLASTVVDAAGASLLTSWINGLTGCN